MSDIREAFEAIKKLAFDAVGGKDPNSDKALVEIYHACEAALQSQTAPAVPEGWRTDVERAASLFRTMQQDDESNGLWEPAAVEKDMAERLEKLLAAPQPDHSGDAGKVVPSDWEGWACHKAGKMPRLYGEKSIAEVNCDTENGERLIFLSSTPSVPENDNGVSSAYDSGYLDAMLYARVCCDRLDNPENTKDYRDCARFLDLIFKSEIDEAARLRTAGDEGDV